MGLQNLAYQFRKSKVNQAYIISYYLLCDPQQVPQMKKDMIFIKGILRFVFFSMKSTEKFWTFAELEKKFAKEEVDQKQQPKEAVSQEQTS
jgi:ribosomal protein S6